MNEKYHRNYMTRHVTGLNNKRQKCIEIYSRECFAKHLTRLQEMQISFNLKCEEEILRLINTSYYIALSNIVFNKYPGICNLQEFNNIQLGNNYRTDKYCRLFFNTIATEMESELSSLIDNNGFISVLSDGSTDAGVTEQEIIYCRLLDKELKASTKSVDIIHLEKANSEGILNAIHESIKHVHDVNFKQKVGDENAEEAHKEFQEKTIKDFCEKVVARNFDGASVISGKRYGVQAKIRRQQPGCVYLWCIARRLELVVLDAVKHDDYLNEFEDIINNNFLMYYLSPKLRQEFKVLGEQLDKITKEFGGLKRVSWLASRYRAISMLANN